MANPMHKKLIYQLTFLRKIVHQRILQSDWTRSTPVHNQILHSLDDYINAKNLKYQLTPSRDTDGQRILQSGCTRGTLAKPNQK